jgi:hypothetical protein
MGRLVVSATYKFGDWNGSLRRPAMVAPAHDEGLAADETASLSQTFGWFGICLKISRRIFKMSTATPRTISI